MKRISKTSRGRRYLDSYERTYNSKLKKLHYFSSKGRDYWQLEWSIQRLNEREEDNLNDPTAIGNKRY